MINVDTLKQNNEYIVGLRREFHKIPELGTCLPKTQKLVCEELDKLGIEYEKNTVIYEGQPDSGVVALIKGTGNQSGADKCVALRADMDALPVLENNEVDYKSLHEGQMHACGHDTHVSMLLGAAKLLNENKDKFAGTVKLIFQTSEEIITGAKLMIEQGVMKNPDVDAIFGIHVWPLLEHKAGTIVTGAGTMMASGDRFKIHVNGVGSHGYNPDRGIDPILTMSEIIASLQKLRSREFPVDEGMVLSICQVHSGTAWNIIPDNAFAEGTVRTLSNEKRAFAKKRIEEIVENICKANRAEGYIEWINGTPAVVNDEGLVNIASNVMENIGDDLYREFLKPTMGNEDVSWYFEHAPGCFAFLTTTNPDKGIDKPLHSPDMQVDEDVLWVGSAFMANAAIDYLNK